MGGIGHTYWQARPLASSRCVQGSGAAVVGLAGQVSPVNQSKLEVITRSRHKARENVHVQATIGFGLTSDWLKKWRENFEPITE